MPCFATTILLFSFWGKFSLSDNTSMESLCPTDILHVELFHAEVVGIKICYQPLRIYSDVVISPPFETLDCDTGTNNDDGQHNENREFCN